MALLRLVPRRRDPAIIPGHRRTPRRGPVRPDGQRIQVDDRKYGRLFEAYFERRSGLLLAIHETLTGVEALWFQQKHNRRAPTWVTSYEDYRPVGEVLLPHRWLRSTAWRSPGRAPAPTQRVDLRLNIAVNGAEPDTVAPEL